MRQFMTPEAEADHERFFALQKESLRLIDLIAAEFKSDPMSVQCFDERVVKSVIETSSALDALKRKGTVVGL